MNSVNSSIQKRAKNRNDLKIQHLSVTQIETASEQKECEEWDEWDKHVSLNPEEKNSKPALDNFSCLHLIENAAAASNIYQHGRKTERWMYGEVKNNGTWIA